MTTPAPAKFRTVTPCLLVRDASAMASFLENAFGATVTMRASNPHGDHLQVRIGDSMVMIGSGPALPEKSTAAIHMFVDDPDATYARAMAAGARSLGAVEDRDYGERSGFVEDPAGNHWYIARALPGARHFTGLFNVNPYLHPASARGLIGFLKTVFNAEEVACFEHGGRVAHAQVRLGDSIVEMGEPTEGSRPAALYVYVDDADAAYARALADGGASLAPPSDQHYGDRVAGASDPYGNQWWIAHRIEAGART